MLPKEFAFAVAQTIYVLMLIFFSMYSPPFGIGGKEFKSFYVKYYTKFMIAFGLISTLIFPILDIIMNLWVTFGSHRDDIKKSIFADAIRMSCFNSVIVLVLLKLQTWDYIYKEPMNVAATDEKRQELVGRA